MGAARAAPSTPIGNTAHLSWYTQNPATTVVPQQRVIISASVLKPLLLGSTPPTPSAMQTYVPSSAGGNQTIRPTRYRDGNGNWLPVPNAASLAGSKTALPTASVFAGAPVYVCVTDENRNADSTAAETLRMTATSDARQLALELEEAGDATGRFCGYFLTTPDTNQANDYTLALKPGDQVRLHYMDASNTSDTSDVALTVPSRGRIVDGGTGSLMDGIELTLIDTATGGPAQVLGQDGASSYPATVASGQTVQDSSGFSYTMQPGGFLYPRVPPGTYKLRVDNPPPGYRRAATSDKPWLVQLSISPALVLPPASLGQPFTLTTTQPVSVDVALVPQTTGLYVTIQGDRRELAVGDLSQFTVAVVNTDKGNAAADVELKDILPPGFRYVPGSLRIDGRQVSEPAIRDNGREMTIPLGTLAGGEKNVVTYVARVTPGASQGRTRNLAQATTAAGIQSNLASFLITVRYPLMRSVNTLYGRVFLGCERTPPGPEQPDLSGIRILLETGRYAITDELGRYHFAQLENGTHVVQVDPASVPPGYRLAPCEQNTRFAGRASSQFVQLHGGALWRADFYLKPIIGSLGLQLTQQVIAADKQQQNHVETGVHLQVSQVDVEDLSIMVSLDSGLAYTPGTSKLGGTAIDDPAILGNVLVYRLGDRAAGWKQELTFVATPKKHAKPKHRFVSSAFANFATSESASRHTDAIEVSLPVTITWDQRSGHYVVHYESGEYDFALVQDEQLHGLVGELKKAQSAGLAGADQLPPAVEKILHDLQWARAIHLNVDGYTDTRPARQSASFGDNQNLSELRAQGLVDFLRHEGIELKPRNVRMSGHGAKRPVASNETPEGRARNRRVEARVRYQAPVEIVPEGADRSPAVVVTTRGQSQGQSESRQQRVPEPPVYDREAINRSQRFTLDQQWLNQANPTPAFVWPKPGAIPAAPAIQVAIKHAAGLRAALYVNGEPVSSRNFLKQTSSEDGRVVVDQWLGVGLDVGHNTLKAVISEDGEPVTTLARQVHFSGMPVAVEVVEDQSWLVADGQHRPFVAVRFHDRWGKPIRAGVTGNWQVAPPYIAWQNRQELQRRKIIAHGPRTPSWTVGRDGLAYLPLVPTADAGEVKLTVPLASGDKELSVWLKPQKRDWVLVGLATGTLAFNDVTDHLEAYDHDPDDDIWQGDRVAFYAKGMVKGGFLLTAAYDSAKDSGVEAQGLEQVIDPNKYYMLYADASRGGNDASSSEKLYLKVERDRFYALFGDYITGLTVTDLSGYVRRFTGIKSGYEGELGGYTFFAARNTEAGVHDEIQGNGTSGLYQLSHDNILLDSETIRLVTRDRYTNIIIESRTLTRFVDYNLDYITGAIFFRRPVPNRDENFNPVYIVANYAVSRGDEKATTAGGRAFLKLADDRLELGATVIHEGAPAGDNRLYGLDAKAELTESLTLEAEVAHTVTGSAGTRSRLVTGGSSSSSTLKDTQGDGYRIALKQQGEQLRGRVYYQKLDDDFGLGQQSLSETGVETYGVESRYHLTDNWSMTGRLGHEQGDLAASRLRELGAIYQGDCHALDFGLRHTQSETDQATGQTGDGRGQSNQVYAGGRVTLTDKLRVHARTNQTIGNSQDRLNPSSSQMGLSYALTDHTRLFTNQTFSDLEANGYSRMTEIGINTRPVAGTQMRSAITQQQTEYGPRVFSTNGLTQGWQVNDRWSLSLGLSRSHTLDEPAPTVDAAQPAATGDSEDFTSAFLGSGYQGDDWTLTNRLEWLNSDSEERYGLFAGVYRRLSRGASVASSLRFLNSDFEDGGGQSNLSLRFGVAWRPLGSSWSFLNQTDLVYNDRQAGGAAFNSPLASSQTSPADSGSLDTSLARGDLRNWQVVNNFNVNYKRDDARWQVSGYYGAKYGRYNFDVGSYNSYTDLIGLETRYDITSVWSMGLVAHRLNSYETDIHRDGYGIETGVVLTDNLWLSIGYNFKGFYDPDFTAAHYTDQGAYVRFRFKFDRDTLKALANG